MTTTGGYTPAATAFRLLAAAADDRDTALHMTLALVALRVLWIRTGAGYFESASINELCTGLHNLPLDTRDSAFSPATVNQAVETLLAIPEDDLSPRLPGDLYPLLMQTPVVQSENAERALKTIRRHGGVFYTPEAIVHRILDLALEGAPADALICDPAMGAGHFLVAAAERIAKDNPGAARAFAATRLCGMDKDPLAVELGRTALHLSLSRESDPWHTPEHRFVAGDALLSATWNDSAEWAAAFPDARERGGFDAIVGNPPYDVLTNFKKHPERRKYADAIREANSYKLSLSGQINLYRCFIERGLQLLRPGGRLAFIVPAGLLRDRTAAPLRKALLDQHAADLFEVYDESDRVFAGVSQSVTVFRAQKDAGRAQTVRIGRPGLLQAIELATIESIDDTSVLPCAEAKDWQLLRWLTEHCPRRFDEIASGYVGEVDQTVYRTHMCDTPTGTLLVRGMHLTPFNIDLDPVAGKERFLDREGFLTQKGQAAKRCEERVNRERVAQLGIRNMQTHPRLVAARLPAGIFAGNSLNLWTPRKGVSTDLLLGLLNSRLYDWRFRIASGNNNINLHEVAALPQPETLAPARVKAVERAAITCESAPVKKYTAAREALDDAVYDLFNLPHSLRI